jgi:hypothetical protein
MQRPARVIRSVGDCVGLGMAGIGRTIGATIVGAIVAAIAGSILLLLGMIVVTQLTGGGGSDEPMGKMLTGLYGEVLLFGIAGFFMGILPALLGAFAVLLPLHLVLARTGRTAPVWYAAAGVAAGLLSILVARYYFGYLAEWVRVEGFTSLLASAAMGGPAGALDFRRIVRGRQAKSAA